MEKFALQQSLLMGKFCFTAVIVGGKYFALKQSLLLRTNVAYLVCKAYKFTWHYTTVVQQGECLPNMVVQINQF